MTVQPIDPKLIIAKKSKKRLSGGIYNYFKINFRNLIELSSMADNKAHIMISVNSILLGVVISFSSYQNVIESGSFMILPASVFFITSLGSLIFAILSARPRIIPVILRDKTGSEGLDYLASFSTFTQLTERQYCDTIDAVFEDSQVMLNNLKKEMYFLGKLLQIKYKFLSISYFVFLMGFVVSVGLFVVTCW